MNKKLLVIALMGCCVIALIGCAGLNSKDKPASNPDLLEPQAIMKFSDVPVPAGFKQMQDSYSFESSGVRVGALKYHGKANPDRVVNFYKEQMVMYNWNLLNVVEYGQRLLNFDRDNETCIINMIPKGNEITLVITIGPKSQISTRKSREPAKLVK